MEDGENESSEMCNESYSSKPAMISYILSAEEIVLSAMVSFMQYSKSQYEEICSAICGLCTLCLVSGYRYAYSSLHTDVVTAVSCSEPYPHATRVWAAADRVCIPDKIICTPYRPRGRKIKNSALLLSEAS